MTLKAHGQKRVRQLEDQELHTTGLDHFPEENPRKRTSRELKEFSKNHEIQGCPQQRYAKAPKHPGMATFDINLQKLPLQRNRIPRTNSSSPGQDYCDLLNDDATGPFQNEHDDKAVTIGLNDIHDIQDKDFLQTLHSPEESGLYCQDASQDNDHLSQSNFILSKLVSSPAVVNDQHDSVLVVLDETKSIYNDVICVEQALSPTPYGFYEELETTTDPLAKFPSLGCLLCHCQRLTQNIHSPDKNNGLKDLIAKYDVSDNSWLCNVSTFGEVIQNLQSSLRAQLVAFVRHFQSRTQKIMDNVLLLDIYSRTIGTNLHRYVQALMEIGINMTGDYFGVLPDVSPTPIPNRHTVQDWQESSSSSSHHVSQALSQLYNIEVPPLKDSVLCVLAGWLVFGPRIAQNVDIYYQVFRYLAWAGATF